MFLLNSLYIQDWNYFVIILFVFDTELSLLAKNQGEHIIQGT